MTIAQKLALKLIAGYQQYISPRKGFACAHRVVFGGASCSQFVYDEIANNGLLSALGKITARGKACGQASRLIVAAQMDEWQLGQPDRKQQQSRFEPNSEEKDCLFYGCTEISCCCWPW